MDNIFSSYNHWIDRRTNNSFFIDPQLAKRDKKRKHHEDIIEVYRHWVNDDFTQSVGIDFTNFNRNRSHIIFIGQFLPNNPEQPRKFYTNDEMALIHLNCEDYLHIFDQYLQILGQQNNFNTMMDEFLERNTNNLNQFEMLSSMVPLNDINRFQRELNNLNQLIINFRNQLRPIIDNELRGECPRERQLSLTHKFSSLLCLRKRSE